MEGFMTTKTDIIGSEWSADEWTQKWTIHVGKAYRCSACGAIVMVTKGGLGLMEPKCCNKDMVIIEKTDGIK